MYEVKADSLEASFDAVNGPTLTIEGRDAGGATRSWYVRLWNYADGAPEDARIAIDFATVAGGFLLPGEADPVWAGDVDRMFISIVPPGYDPAGGVLDAPAEGWVAISDLACDGSGSVIATGDVMMPPNGLSIATGYDDSYNLAPERVVRNALRLGYRGAINHYVGMSHYFRLAAAGEAFLVAGAGLNVAAAAWHADFAARVKAAGYELILSLSYELLAMHCPEAWQQRAANGDAALTGWDPPSALLSPANGAAMDWLQGAARAFAAIARDAGLRARFQVGEPWWWVTADGRICLYDAAARVALAPMGDAIDDVRGALGADQLALLDRAGALLAATPWPSRGVGPAHPTGSTGRQLRICSTCRRSRTAFLRRPDCSLPQPDRRMDGEGRACWFLQMRARVGMRRAPRRPRRCSAMRRACCRAPSPLCSIDQARSSSCCSTRSWLWKMQTTT